MAWNLKGTYTETGSCDFFCPCNFNLANGADYDRRELASTPSASSSKASPASPRRSSPGPPEQ